MTQTVNAATELTREHDEIDRLAIRIAMLGPGPERAALVHEVSARFLIHARAEERYLHPAVRRLVRDGSVLVSLQMSRNRALARTIEAVERGGAEEDELDILVGHLVIGVQDHVERQGAVLLPALIEACPPEEAILLGEKLHEGIAAARKAAERAGARACELAGQLARETPAPGDGETRCRGFRALLRRFRRKDGPPEVG